MENKGNIRIRKIVVDVKGKNIEFDEYYMIEPKTGEEIFDRDIEIENDIHLYDIYKKQMGLLTTSEIKKIRKKYEMNQKEFALALGLGEITIHRFENGSIQTESVDAVIRLSENPEIMFDLLIKNQINFAEEVYQKLLKKVSLLKKYKEHKIAEFNSNDFFSLNFKTEKVESVAKQLIFKYNSKVDMMSKKYALNNIGNAEYITPLKIQKLLYYIQGISAVIFGEKAFDNDILAWSYGPVVNEIYHIYNGRRPIESGKDNIKISDGLNKVIDIVISSYGQIEAEKLIDLTHDEEPWINTEKDKVIDFELIKKYFKQVYDN